MGQKRKRQKLLDGGDVADRVAEDQELPHTKSTTASSSDAASKSSRTIFVRSLHADTTSEDLTNHFSFYFPVKHAVAVLDTATKKCRGYGFVTLTDPKDAIAAKEQLDGSTLIGNKIKTDVAEPRRRNEKPAATSSEPQAEASPQKAAAPEKTELPPTKLIVRNLPWTIDSAEKLSNLFRSYGKVNYAIVPKDKQGLMRGFGIIILRGRKNAEKAIAGLNEKEIEGRTIAVDWAVDRDKWQNATKDSEDTQDGPDDTQQDAATDDDEEVTSDSEAADDASASDDDDSPGSDTEDEAEHKPAENLTTTLFVRNIPFMATDETLYEHFSRFGKLRYARIVLDPETERPRGTGFVRFVHEEDALDCLKGAPKQAQLPTTGKPNVSILQNEELDPSGKYTFESRILQVSRAVNRDEASRLADEGEKRRNHRDRDKRRIFLLNEGAITPASPFYKELSQTDIQMREASAKQRKKLLDTNPSLFLSLTRLSVRNIPRHLKSGDLKDLARQAVVGFAKDVKDGLRERLSKEEVLRGGDEMKRAEHERKAKGKGIVKQVKIEFESREGSKTKEGEGGRSRGYGFIEYHTHRSALMGLRWLNGRTVGSGAKGDAQDRKRRLIVEFAIENAQVVNRRKMNQEKARQPAPARDRATDGAGEQEEDKREGRTGGGRAAGKKPGPDDKATEEKQGLARRQQIIARKRQQRRQRKTARA